MSFPFDSQQGLVIIRTELWGPAGSIVLRLALDTGATGTVVNIGMLVTIGYDPGLAPDRIQITTGSGVEFAPRVTLEKITALGQERTDLCWGTPCHRAQALMGCLVWTSFADRI